MNKQVLVKGNEPLECLENKEDRRFDEYGMKDVIYDFLRISKGSVLGL